MGEAVSPSGRLSIPVSHGHLEAILRDPERPVAAAVLCHPHPQHGGTMNNNVVYRTAKALVAAGVAALRFNFRGVGSSTGSYGQAVAEEEDVEAALSWLRARHPAVPLWVAGFSFGARVGLVVGARHPEVEKLLGIGLALPMFDYRFLGTSPKPKAFIQGSEDEFADRPAIEAAFAGMAEPKRLWIVDGATHLFPRHLDPFERAADEAAIYLRDAS